MSTCATAECLLFESVECSIELAADVARSWASADPRTRSTGPRQRVHAEQASHLRVRLDVAGIPRQLRARGDKVRRKKGQIRLRIRIRWTWRREILNVCQLPGDHRRVAGIDALESPFAS